VPGWTLEPGIAYAITDDGPFNQYGAPGRPSKAEEDVGEVVRQLASNPPCVVGACTVRDPLHRRADRRRREQHGRSAAASPVRLVDALDDQLDFAAPLTRPLNFLVYENTAWIPTRAFFAEADADDTRQAGFESLARLELQSAATPIAVGASDNADVHFDAVPGAVTIATGVDERWKMNVDGLPIAARPAFGATTGYDIATPGSATLSYHTDAARALSLIGQLLLWLLLALGMSRFDRASISRWRRRRVDAGPDAPLLSIDAPIVAPIELPDDSTVLLSMDEAVEGAEIESLDGEPREAEPQQAASQETEPHEAGVE
jgi:hypothetical protein